MDSVVPSDADERAFVLPQPFSDPDEPSQLTLAEELEAALSNRRMWELPTDHESLVDAVRAVRRKGRSSGGTYWTEAEEQDDWAFRPVRDQVKRALEPFADQLAGRRVGWDGHSRIYVIGVVGVATALRAAIAAIPGHERVRLRHAI